MCALKQDLKNAEFLFTFSYPHMVEKVNIENENLMHLHILRSSESENPNFSGWSECVSIYYQHNSKINCNRNSKFGIL